MKRSAVILAFLFILAGCILIAGVMFSLNWDFAKLSTEDFETNRHDISEDFRSISIRCGTADVEFRLAEGDSASVLCREAAKVRHSVSVVEGTLVIEPVDTRKWYDHISLFSETPQITVSLPAAEYGALTLKGSTGDIALPEGLRFESIDVNISTGDVQCCASANGDISLRTDTGDIFAEGITARSLTVTVTTGKTELTDVSCENLSSAGSTGDLLLKSVRATGWFALSRDTGDIRFEACDAAELEIQTDTGDVTGTLTSYKVFLAESDTGTVSVPGSVTGGKCEIKTDTGDIRIDIK